VRSKSVDLVALLESGDLDYAFEYESVAKQHGLKYIELGDAIDLSAVGQIGDSGVSYADFYAKASVQTLTSPDKYSKQTGAAIVFGLTIPEKAPNPSAAVEFIKLLLSEEGKDVLEVQNGQPCVDPPQCDNTDNLPSALKKLVVAV
jgi:molybdate/tungstate transport system substrate-binding protein